MLDEAWSLIAGGGAREREGLIRANQADLLFLAGRLWAAQIHAEEAVRILESSSPATIHFPRALTSLGRIHRVLNQPEQTLALSSRAVPLLEKLGDFDGAAQAQLAVAFAAEAVTRESPSGLPGFEEAGRMIGRAVELARRSQRSGTVHMTLRERGLFLLRQSRPSEARTDLDEADRHAPFSPFERAVSLLARANLLFLESRLPDALSTVDDALAAQESVHVERRAAMHLLRAMILEQLDASTRPPRAGSSGLASWRASART